MTEELVKRLRISEIVSVGYALNMQGSEAADRIEALTAENERLRELLCLADELLMDAWGAFPLYRNPLREKMMLIREATGNDYHERKRKARAALEGKP